MTTGISESVVEDAALEWFKTLGYSVLHGPEIAPGEPGAERGSYQKVVLGRGMKKTIIALNPQPLQKHARKSSANLFESNLPPSPATIEPPTPPPA